MRGTPDRGPPTAVPGSPRLLLDKSLDLAGLDPPFAALVGDGADVTGVRTEWFDLMIHNALVVTAADGYRPFGEIAAACLRVH